MSIKNMTPHAINVYSNVVFDPKIRKYHLSATSALVESIEPSGKMLSAKMTEEEADPIGWIQTKRTKIVSADPIPDGDDFYIVSQLYLSAARQMGWNTSNLLTIGGAVVDTDGRTIGAAFLVRN